MSDDPYKYFRIEARELVEALGGGALEIERGRAGAPVVARLLRAAHTLKGAARVVRQPEIAELAHAIEDVLGPHRDVTGFVPASCARDLLSHVDGIAARLAALSAAPSSQPVAPVEDRFQTVRVDVADMNRLHESALQAGFQLALLRRTIDPLAKSAAAARALAEQASGRLRGAAAELGTDLEDRRRAIGAVLEDSERDVEQLRQDASAMRLMPAGVLFPLLERAVRDAAQSLGKRVAFSASGGETRLDAHVLTGLSEALLQVARNAVAHGIERPEHRGGKAPEGRLELRVERAGNRITFSLADDGAGVDVEAVRRAAARRRLLPPSELAHLGPEDLVRLILQGGVTTAPTTTEVSGRGIGLDVVRETLSRLRGDVAVRTSPGLGTTFILRVPFSLSSIPALVVGAGGTTCCLPLDAIPGARRLVAGEVARTPHGASVVHDGAAVPFIPLAAALGQPDGDRPGRAWSAVIVHHPPATMALGVDRIDGTARVLVRPLPPWAEVDSLIAGAALGPGGDAWLVLDPATLVTRAAGWRAREATAPPALPVLVVDDSLTTRMLEKSILETAGYEVDLATSGEEALTKARARHYGVMVVDVEMPGMDGFECVSRVRSDASLKGVPCILVTSRNSAEDRRRGEEAGARAYIVKSEFDQRRLVALIRDLVGET